MAGKTLAAMAAGGIHDQLAGGFARYGVDRAWVVPHFEKMLYDNGQLLSVYARWAARHDDVQAAGVARGIADFLLAELGTAEGAFASALDADSEGEEGTFYVWTPAQLAEVLGPDDGAWAAKLLTVTDGGTFENGTSTLQLQAQPDDPDRWESVRTRLLEARSTRVRPARDDKVVAAWNGLAISGLVEAGTLLDVPAYVDAAVRCGEFLAAVHLTDGRLLRVSRDGVAGSHAGVLEDHGCVATAFVALACATGDGVWLQRAGLLLDAVLEHFAADDGGFHDTADDAEALLVRPRDPSDNASPSGHSAVIHALLGYAALTGSGHHRDAAERALLVSRRLADSSPRFAGWSLAAAETALDGPVEVAVVGPAGAERDAARARRPPARADRVGRRGGRARGERDPADGRPRSRGRSTRGVRLPQPGLPAPGHRGRGPASPSSPASVHDRRACDCSTELECDAAVAADRDRAVGSDWLDGRCPERLAPRVGVAALDAGRRALSDGQRLALDIDTGAGTTGESAGAPTCSLRIVRRASLGPLDAVARRTVCCLARGRPVHETDSRRSGLQCR